MILLAATGAHSEAREGVIRINAKRKIIRMATSGKHTNLIKRFFKAHQELL
jgi:hypothetical protein